MPTRWKSPRLVTPRRRESIAGRLSGFPPTRGMTGLKHIARFWPKQLVDIAAYGCKNVGETLS